MHKFMATVLALTLMVGCNTSKQDIRKSAVDVSKRASAELVNQKDIQDEAESIKSNVAAIDKIENMPEAAVPVVKEIEQSADKIVQKAASTQNALEQVVTLSDSIVQDTDGVDNKPDFFTGAFAWIKKWLPIILVIAAAAYLLISPFGGVIAALVLKIFKTGFGLSRATVEQTKLLHEAYVANPTPELSNLVTLHRKSLKNEAAWRKVKEQASVHKSRPKPKRLKPK